MIPLLFLLLGVSFLGVLVWALYQPGFLAAKFMPSTVAAALAIAGAVIIMVYLSAAPQWQQPIEIAWTGVFAPDAHTGLEIGGLKRDASIGWPTGAFLPRVKMEAKNDGSVALTVSGGAGFVKANDGEFLNGLVLRLGQPVTIRGFSVEVQREWFFGRKLAIYKKEGQDPLAAISAPESGEQRVISLESALDTDVVHLRSNHDAAAAAELEDWAAGLRLLIPSKGDYRLLAPDSPDSTTQLSLPASLSIYWPSHSVKMEVSKKGNSGILEAEFAPPWRVSSPLPPDFYQAGADRSLTVTAYVLPGDHAFVLPLGEHLGRFRADLRLDPLVSTDCGRTASPNVLDRYSQTSAPPPKPRWDGVICTQSLEVGSYQLQFAGIRDLPRLARVVFALGLAFVCFLVALWQCLERMRYRDRWVIAGLGLSVWLLLLLRCHLALRYALDARFLDSLAVHGVTTAFMALCAVPGVVLLAAPLWRDQYRLQKERENAARRMLGNGALLLVAALSQALLVRAFWPNVPDSYSPAGTLKDSFLLMMKGLLIFAVFALFVAFQYIRKPSDEQRSQKPTISGYLLRFMERLLFGIFEFYHRIATETGPRLWHAVEEEPGSKTKILGRERMRSQKQDDRFWQKFGVNFGSILLLLFAIYVALVFNLGGTRKYIQEILASLLLCWFPTCLLLSSRKVFPPGSALNINKWRCFAVVSAILAVSVFLYPFSVHDVGGIVATAGVFLPLAVLLLLGGRPLTLQWLPAGLLIVIILLAAFLYLNFEVTAGPLSTVGETAAARILAWKEGAGAEPLLLSSKMDKDSGAPLPVTRRHLADAIEHSQENTLMAHEGRYWGLGYGNAPTRRSLVRQDTLQYDSAFSFFILSENGLIGGVSLLLLYFFPLALVWISCREAFDIGHGFAVIIATAFLLAALTHATMNWGNLPFTGRNLPFLSVNSLSDLLLWTILFGVIIQAMLWRVKDSDEFLFDSDSILAPTASKSPFLWKCVAGFAIPASLLIWGAVAGVLTVRNEKLEKGFDWSGLLQAVDTLVTNGDLKFDKESRTIKPEMPLNTLIGQEIARFNALTEDEKLEGTRSRGPRDFSNRLKKVKQLEDYDRLLAELHAATDEVSSPRRPSLFEVASPVEWADLDETIPAEDAGYRLHANPAYNARVSFQSGSGPEDFPRVSLREGTKGTYTISGENYEFSISDRPSKKVEDRTVILSESGKSTLAVTDAGNSSISRARVNLHFNRDRKSASYNRTLGDYEVRQDGLYFRPARIILQLRKKDAKVPLVLSEGVLRRVEPGDLIETKEQLAKNFRPRMSISHSARGALIGPAWANGMWVLAYDSDPYIPWTRNLVYVLPFEWRHLGAKAAAERYSTLTLDTQLQRDAQRFVAEKGRAWHRSLIDRHTSRQALPPRVALSVIALPGGDVLALGGWPHMNSSDRWLSGPDGDVVPDYAWLEEHAPKSIRQRYAGDRNFDRLLMGSSTKPLWAAAVLAIYPRLDGQLAVTGPGGQENQIFGIELNKEWHLTHPPDSIYKNKSWCDFTSYLARSDNRYQTRLGFLGLTDPGSHDAFPVGPASPSSWESVDGGNSPWKHSPLFPDEIAFSASNPAQMRNLQSRPLAARLRGMFGIGVERGDVLEHRYSFWTGNEADDWTNTTEPLRRAHLSLFAPVSPESPQFALDGVETPRQYINLLLGGGQNLWANVDFAGAFATAVRGLPVTAHIAQHPTAKSNREEFPAIAVRLKPGLEAVIMDRLGTANPAFVATGALAFLHTLPGVKVYGKTGTLGEEKGLPTTSRLVLALVREDTKGRIQDGLVFSIVVERGEMGLASRWLGEFLVAESQSIRSYLGSH
ncbi:MAG TPA: FtsW/RodA/SpoVE family cell cycle protein [Candidatus Angelobacter sp.]|nr:FtsW/RodA/SpoVE family cell cycle protein [Candidatus Angelobacter sp.]